MDSNVLRCRYGGGELCSYLIVALQIGEIFYIKNMVVFNVLNRSPTSQTCHQHKNYESVNIVLGASLLLEVSALSLGFKVFD